MKLHDKQFYWQVTNIQAFQQTFRFSKFANLILTEISVNSEFSLTIYNWVIRAHAEQDPTQCII